MACRSPDPWQGVPIDREYMPEWAKDQRTMSSGISSTGGRAARAYRMLHPSLGYPFTKWTDDSFHGEHIGPDGSPRTVTVGVYVSVEAVDGPAKSLIPNGAQLVVTSEDSGRVAGVMELGGAHREFECTGQQVSTDLEGWCFAFLGRTHLQVYSDRLTE